MGREPKDELLEMSRLPRLLYVADVPVEAHVHGSLLLYRLLRVYPRDKLRIVECFRESRCDRRIRDVQYHAISSRWSRLLQNRFGAYLAPVLAPALKASLRDLAKITEEFRPEAVLTVLVGYSWQAAARYANQMGLPLHLIVHDDWPNDSSRLRLERYYADGVVRKWYSRAASRLCVSPYMQEEYARRYKAVGDVLYPCRDINTLKFDSPPQKLYESCDPFTVAFAGAIYREYARSLQRMAKALQLINGRLLIYGPKPYDAVSKYLGEPNIEIRGVVSSAELISRCREDAHALFVPMSYRAVDRCNMEVSFPSKLADYTAIGLPLIIDGPKYCSAIRWAQENPGVCEMVTEETLDALQAALRRLMNPALRMQLAEQAILRGRQYFGCERALSLLATKLCTETVAN
jgi:glycosyltransferase involved in cell wall biosynthesis